MLTSHCTVWEWECRWAAAVKVTVLPALTVWLAGFVVTVGIPTSRGTSRFAAGLPMPVARSYPAAGQ